MNIKQRRKQVEEEAWKVLTSTANRVPSNEKDHSLFHKRGLMLFDIRYNAKSRIQARMRRQQKRREEK